MIHTETKIYDGIEVRAQKPLDTRTIVTYREDLCKLSSWPHDSYIDENGVQRHIIYMKEGMVITVTGTKKEPVHELYILADLDNILDPNLRGWRFVGTSSGGGGASLPTVGNIDGGGAMGRYTLDQVIYCGNAYSRGETEDE